MFVLLLAGAACLADAALAHAQPEWRAGAHAAMAVWCAQMRAAMAVWCAQMRAAMAVWYAETCSALYAAMPDIALEAYAVAGLWAESAGRLLYKGAWSLLQALKAVHELLTSYFAILGSVLDFVNEFTGFVVVCLRYVRESQAEFVEVHEFVRFFQSSWEYWTHQSGCKRLYFFTSTDALFGVQSGRRLREEIWKFLPRLGWIYFVLLTFYYYVKVVAAMAYAAVYAVAARRVARIALHQPALALVLMRAQALRRPQAAAPALAAPAAAAARAQDWLAWAAAGLVRLVCTYTRPLLLNLAFAFLMFCMHMNAFQRMHVVVRKVASNDTWTYGVVGAFGTEMTCEQTMWAWFVRVFSGSWAFY
jgi:hypothetical protein